MKLNVGCGAKLLVDYINIDLYSTHPKVVRMDVSKLGFPDDSCDEVLAEDILEHFPRLKWKEVVAEWIRVIKPNGLLVLQFPDMRSLSKALLDSQTPEDWEVFNRRIFGGQGDGTGDGAGMFHYTGFSSDYLRWYLETKHGLKYITHSFHNYNCTLAMKK